MSLSRGGRCGETVVPDKEGKDKGSGIQPHGRSGKHPSIHHTPHAPKLSRPLFGLWHLIHEEEGKYQALVVDLYESETSFVLELVNDQASLMQRVKWELYGPQHDFGVRIIKAAVKSEKVPGSSVCPVTSVELISILKPRLVATAS